MREDTVVQLVGMAKRDAATGELARAKQRLRALLRETPYSRPALKLMGELYYLQKDYRNAVTYWSRCGYWDGPFADAAARIFRATTRALAHENSKAARHCLMAFAGSSPPGELGRTLSRLQDAYFQLDRKRSKLRGIACVPFSGGCLMGVLTVLGMALGAGWSWFKWMGGLAIAATLVTLGVCTWSYFRASGSYRQAVRSAAGEGD